MRNQGKIKKNMDNKVHCMLLYLTKSMLFVGKEEVILPEQVHFLIYLDAKDAVVNQILTNLDGV